MAKRRSLNLTAKDDVDWMMKCLAVCLVSIGAEAGEDTYALDGVVHGGTSERCDTYEFSFKSLLTRRTLSN